MQHRLSGTDSLANLDHQTHSHLSNHLWNLTSSSYPIDSVCVCVCVCVCAVPSVWHSLPCKVRSSNTLTSFKSSLKSHLFKLPCWLCVCVCVCVCVCCFHHVLNNSHLSTSVNTVTDPLTFWTLTINFSNGNMDIIVILSPGASISKNLICLHRLSTGLRQSFLPIHSQ